MAVYLQATGIRKAGRNVRPWVSGPVDWHSSIDGDGTRCYTPRVRAWAGPSWATMRVLGTTNVAGSLERHGRHDYTPDTEAV